MKPSKWQWFGCPGHLVVSDRCRFHMHTRIGDYTISTVGAYFPQGHPEGPLDSGAEIGFGKKYETYVFRVGGYGHHGEGEIDPLEIDSLSANTEVDATANHMAMCRKWAKRVK